MLELVDMTRSMAEAEAQRFGPAFANQLPAATAVAVCRLHKLFGQMLLSWMGTVEALGEEQVQVRRRGAGLGLRQGRGAALDTAAAAGLLVGSARSDLISCNSPRAPPAVTRANLQLPPPLHLWLAGGAGGAGA
jgi:hypothetical protein